MKLQCDLCREVVVADFAVGDGVLAVWCPACGGRFEVAPTRPPGAPASAPAPVAAATAAAAPAVAPAVSPAVVVPPAAPVAAPAAAAPAVDDAATMHCPKCGTDQPPGAACRSCGLVAARFAAYASADVGGAPDAVTAAWARCEERWTDDAGHEAFVEQVAEAGAYAWAARRYRDAQRARPDDAIAAAQLARLARMAEVTLLSTATAAAAHAAGKKPYSGSIAILIALLVALAAGVVYALVSGPLSSPGASGEPPPTIAPLRGQRHGTPSPGRAPTTRRHRSPDASVPAATPSPSPPSRPSSAPPPPSATPSAPPSSP